MLVTTAATALANLVRVLCLMHTHVVAVGVIPALGAALAAAADAAAAVEGAFVAVLPNISPNSEKIKGAR